MSENWLWAFEAFDCYQRGGTEIEQSWCDQEDGSNKNKWKLIEVKRRVEYIKIEWREKNKRIVHDFPAVSNDIFIIIHLLSLADIDRIRRKDFEESHPVPPKI